MSRKKVLEIGFLLVKIFYEIPEINRVSYSHGES